MGKVSLISRSEGGKQQSAENLSKNSDFGSVKDTLLDKAVWSGQVIGKIYFDSFIRNGYNHRAGDQGPMTSPVNKGCDLNILTINRHDAYILGMSQVGYNWDVVINYKGQNLPWRFRQEDRPANIHLKTWDDVQQKIEDRYYDAIILHTAADVWHFRHLPIPKIFIGHIALYSHSLKFKIKGLIKRSMIRLLMKSQDLKVCFISPWKQSTWNLPASTVIKTPPYVPCAPKTPNDAKHPKVMVIGNNLKRRPEIDYGTLEKLRQSFPLSIVGSNPDIEGAIICNDRQEYYEQLKDHQILVYLVEYPWDDGYNLAMLEAMKMGMAVVGLKHPTSVIDHGVNGYLCNSFEELTAKVRELQADPARCHRFAKASQEIVAEEFSVDEFVAGWQQLIQDRSEKK